VTNAAIPGPHFDSGVEQRKAHRFDLRLPLAITRTGRERMNIVCETVNISSCGVLFRSRQTLAPSRIEYVVTLIARDDSVVKIHCFGDVVRIERRGDGFQIAATLQRHQFVREER
jgi:hypothetical protein